MLTRLLHDRRYRVRFLTLILRTLTEVLRDLPQHIQVHTCTNLTAGHDNSLIRALQLIIPIIFPFEETYRSLHAIVAQPKSCPFEVNTMIGLKKYVITSDNNGTIVI